MKNKLELFVDKVNEYGGYAEIFKTQGKVKRIIAVFSLNKPEIYVARLKYGCIVVSAVNYADYCKGKTHYCLYGIYAIVETDDMKILDEKLEAFFTSNVVREKELVYPVGFIKIPSWRYIKAIKNIALELGYYPCKQGRKSLLI